VQLAHKKITLGPQICYESLNPRFSRGLAEKGAQILFNVTNDSWFGWWAEPFQHQIMTLARAVEVRRPLVRSTNTGISSVILANGQMLENSPINSVWAHTYEVKYLEKPPLSFYTKWGHFDWIFWLLVMIGLILTYRNKGQNV
jgi:apolipoprotein N-acyltransferase